MPEKLIHIRLDEGLIARIKATAKQQRRSMQAVVANLISAGEADSVDAGGDRFGLTIYEDREAPELAARLLEVAQNCTDFFAFGLNLLDFLRESGWGHPSLRAALESERSKCRLALEDSAEQSFQQRIQLTHRASDSNGRGNFTKSAKLHSADEAKMRVLGLREENPDKVHVRQLGLYPVVRWAVSVDGKVFYEPHCYRMHTNGGVVEEKLPVFEAQEGSAAHQRMLEHCECVWDLGGEI